MRLIKRIGILAIALSLIIVGYNDSNVSAKSILNINEKASVLQELKILKGNGDSLDLDSHLKRSEAAAFIVRLLCMEEEVLNNKEKYNDFTFSDVPKDSWFAPYIGYCVEKGIIDGYMDNTFKPSNELGEKAFLKLVLTALGYKYNNDFTWNNVFEFAYSKGVVKELKYVNNPAEDKDYTRGKVVKVLFTALQLKDNKTKVSMIQKFIDKAVISKETAKSHGLLIDDLETEITSVKPINSKTIEVTFNEQVQEFTPENLLIYETNATSEVLIISDVVKKDSSNTYIITTDQPQKMDEEYTLLIDKVVDNNGNTSTSFSNQFMGFRAEEVESDFFKISKIDALSNNIIYVYFTQPINENALQSSFYSLLKDDVEIVNGNNSDMLINKLPTCNNGISIYLKNYTFTEEEFYKLSIKGNLSSIYGVRLNDGDGDAIKFKASIDTNTPFSLDNCTAINNRTIELNFNKQVNPVIAKQIYSYYITNQNNVPIRVLKADVINEGQSAGKTVRLTVDTTFQVNKEYKIMINNMTDVTRQFSITEKQYTFSTYYYTVTDVDIDAVLPLDENTVILYVDRALDQESAQTVANYQIQGVTNSSFIAIPSAAYYNKNEDEQVVKIYLPKNKKLKYSEVYKFRILSTLKDAMGNFQSSIKTFNFTQTSSQIVDTYISEAKVIGEGTIKLSFNKEIALDIPNVLNTNYSITYVDNGVEYTKIPIGANYINPTTLVLTFDMLDKEKDYTVTYNKLVDYGKNVTDNLNHKYFTEVIIGN